jgi:hypothetical protein
MSARILTVDVEILGCGSNTPIREFQIPDTGDAAINQQIAELIHTTLLGAPYECTRCSGGDYHFHRWVRFVGPVTHRAAPAANLPARQGPRPTDERRKCDSLEPPVDKFGMPFVAPFDSCL